MAFYQNQLQNFFLAGAGAVAGATTITLKSMKTIDGAALTMATDFGSIAYGTLEPGNNTLEESISFSSLVNNANGTVTLGGIKSITFGEPYTSTTGLSKTHAGSTTFVVSNTSGYYTKFAIKENDETVTGSWSFPTPLSNANAATKLYVDSIAFGTPITNAAIVVQGTAGENVTVGQVLYLKVSDGLWYVASSASAATTDLLQLGIAQTTVTTGNPITGGILVKGVDTHQSGLVAGTIYYLSTAGAISTSAGATARAIGQGRNTTSIYFDPVFFYIPTSNQKSAFAGLSGTTPSATNLFLDEASFTGMVAPFAQSATPTGWLPCDGAAVSRTTYARLFTAISTTFGIGNGSTTFNVPSMLGRGIIGLGAGTKLLTFVSRSSNVITVSGAANSATSEVITGQAVLYSAPSGAMTGLSDNTTYYIIKISNTTFSLASSLANAQNGVVISLSSSGSGTQTFTITLTTHALADTGGSETHAMNTDELLGHTHSIDKTAGTNGFAASGTTGPSSSTSSSTGGNTAMPIMNPFMSLNYCIKY